MSVPDTDAVLRAEQARTDAMVAGDVAALEILLDDECRYVHSSGAMDTKRSYLDKLQARAFEYRWIRSLDQVVIPLGGGAMVSHRMEADLAVDGVFRDYRSHAVAAWRACPSEPLGLRLVYFQATTLPGAAG